MKYLITVLGFVICGSTASGEIRTEVVEYRDGDVALEGYLAWDDAQADPRGTQTVPGILIVHQWMGLTDYEQSRARQLAELGYIAFALDIYGQGIRPTSMQQAGAEASKYKQDRKLFRRRLNCGLKQLASYPGVSAQQLAAIGYCFGGTGVLELARSGADIRGLVSFHGGLDSPAPQDGKQIKAKILICHGADDPFVPAKDIDAMKAEFNEANVDWQMIYYGKAVHSFTQPMAGNDTTRGAAYQEQADHRSWQAMRSFFAELFPQSR